MEDRDVFILEEIVDYCDKIAETLVRHGEDFGKFKDEVMWEAVTEDVPRLREFCARQIG